MKQGHFIITLKLFILVRKQTTLCVSSRFKNSKLKESFLFESVKMVFDVVCFIQEEGQLARFCTWTPRFLHRIRHAPSLIYGETGIDLSGPVHVNGLFI